MGPHSADRRFYRWRTMTPVDRALTLQERRSLRRPWHSPPHIDSDSQLYLATAACYEHRSVIGKSPVRMSEFSRTLLNTCEAASFQVYAWVVLPNHYHVLLRAERAKSLVATLGRMHGRTSHDWNSEDHCRGRKIWFNAMETIIKSDRHFWATMVYVLNNPVKHGYVSRWQDWPFSNAEEWLESVGREAAVRIWNEFPIDDFGRDWDPPEL